MTNLSELAARIEAAPKAEYLRFSVVRGAPSEIGRYGRIYSWGSVRTNSDEIAGLLAAMWSNRAGIAAALRAKEVSDHG